MIVEKSPKARIGDLDKKKYLVPSGILVHLSKQRNQCFGSGSARIRIKKCLMDPDPGGKKA